MGDKLNHRRKNKEVREYKELDISQFDDIIKKPKPKYDKSKKQEKPNKKQYKSNKPKEDKGKGNDNKNKKQNNQQRPNKQQPKQNNNNKNKKPQNKKPSSK